MKNKFLYILLLALVGPSLLTAKERSNKTAIEEEPNIITLAEFAKAIETGLPLEKFRNVILECPQGAELPLKMTIRGDMLSLEPNLLTIKLLKPCYIKSGKGPLLFSSDLKKWQDFSEFFTGKAAASLDFLNQMTQVNLELELNQHKNRWEVPLQYKDTRRREVYIHTWTHCLQENPPQSLVQGFPNVPLIPLEESQFIEERTETKSKWW